VRWFGSTGWRIALGAAVLGGWLGWQWLGPDADAQQASASSVPGTASSAASGASGLAPYSAAGLATRDRQLQLWQLRHERAEQVYNSYREATRLPPHSRPLGEHSDQARPFEPVVSDAPMRDDSGRPVEGLRIRATQDKVFVSGTESARFTVEALDAAGRRLPLVVRRATAQTVPDTRALTMLTSTELVFTDDGAGADDAAQDGRHAALLTPARQGFAGRAGTIRVVTELAANGQQGVVAFDIVYLPEVAGRWTGVREAMEDGALVFYLRAQVAVPGRYVASARVHDANGGPVALLQFNEVLPAGAVEFRLPLAGLLVHEALPTFPLRLVDVEGFLLKPGTFPDRVLLPRLPGVVHESKVYPLGSFSAEEWRSEERDRYLAEYARDLARAEEELGRLRR